MNTCICKMYCSGPANGSTDHRPAMRWIGDTGRSQSGIGYVALLGLLALVSTLALAFVHSVGVESAGNQSRIRQAQSDYLAQSAANHALWRLLNEPDFVPEADQYQMHSLAGGRYGYKVRRPGAATFPTVSAVGAMDGSVIRQSYVPYIIPENVIGVYGPKSDPNPDYRRMVGAGFSDAADTVVTGSDPINWMDVEGCPLRNEAVMATIDEQGTITLAVWDGAAWGNAHTLGLNGDNKQKCFDIIYESQSGRALAVGRNGSSTTARYNIWDGTAWIHATAQAAFDITKHKIQLVTMAACPGNDHILIATVNELDKNLELFLWDGSAFTHLAIMPDGLVTDDYGIVQLVYERQSGDALVIWSAKGKVRCRIWNGASLGAETIVTQFSDKVKFLRAAPDPASDYILLAGVDEKKDLTVSVWDGEAWIDGREVETNTSHDKDALVDVAWEAAGEEAVVTWAPNNETRLRYLTWRKGTALADVAIEQGIDIEEQPWLVRLHPLSQSERLVLLASSELKALRYSLWTGDRFIGDPGIVLAPELDDKDDRPFDLAETEVPISGGTGTGVGAGNQPPVVDAGPDQTVPWPTAKIQLSGSASDDGLPDPPADISTTWSLVSGPGTVIFDDATQLDPWLKVESAGTYVFRLTASDTELSAQDDVTVFLAPPQILMTYGSDRLYLDKGGTEVVALDSSPKYRRFDGSAWSPNARVTDLHPRNTDWMELTPASTRQEMIMGALQDDDSLHLAVWNGTGWNNTLQFTASADNSTKCYATAYESRSGDALVVGRDGIGTTVKYTVWDGAAWLHDPPALAFDMMGSGDVDVVEMAASPVSDEILIAVIDSAKDLRLYQWDGDAFNFIDLLTDDANTKHDGAVEIVYERQSGHALVIYSERLSSMARFHTWDGTSLSAQHSLPDFGQSAKIIRAAADPTSDVIVAAALDAGKDIKMAVWDGDAWTEQREIETDAAEATKRCFDVAWMPSGNGALVGWGTDGDRLSYLYWTRGSMLAGSTVQTGPDFNDTIQMLRLLPLRAYGTILIVGVNGENEARFTQFTGSRFTT
ncbi:MAG: hypothetical protein PVJ19_13030, partial [Desulfobacteraceae bacterium]